MKSRVIPRRITDRLDGFRGSFLLILTPPWVFVGVSYLLVETEGRSLALSYLPEWMDQNELGWAWILSGLVMTICVVLGRAHPKWTTLGYLAAMGPPTLWAVLFGISQAVGASPTAIVSVVMYGTFAGLIYFCSGWPNPMGPRRKGGS